VNVDKTPLSIAGRPLVFETRTAMTGFFEKLFARANTL
jgi:hypothetical protein